ncbi:MAG: tetratricopeptide repeat protein [Bacteroidetes bacterium]|nr:tetratricopeptide repeat protein [Bacteroidota bacterium]
MKTFRLVSCFLILYSSLNSQNKNVISAWKYLKDFQDFQEEPSLLKAKETIEPAILDAETKDDAKTWLYRGKIYHAIFDNNYRNELAKQKAEPDNSKKALIAYQNTNSLELITAYESYKKCIELDAKKQYKDEVAQKQKECAIHFENKGITAYNNKALEDALKMFETAFECNTIMGKVDTVNSNNAAIVSEKLGNFSKAKSLYEKLIDMKFGKANTYSALITACYNLKDTASAVSAMTKGRQAYPNDPNLLITETNYFLRVGKNKEASDNLDKAIKNNPTDANLYLVLGNIYDNLANPKDAKGEDAPKPANYQELFSKAESNYKKAIELNPKFFDALYNLGILYNNVGVSISKNADNIMDHAKFAVQNKKADEEFAKAIPYLESALEINGKDNNTLFALKQLYTRTSQKDKLDRINKLMGTTN